jgi:hypothetical protein
MNEAIERVTLPLKATRRARVSHLHPTYLPQGQSYMLLEKGHPLVSKINQLTGQEYLKYYILENLRDNQNGLAVLTLAEKINTEHGDNYGVAYIGDMLGEMKCSGLVSVVTGKTSWVATILGIVSLDKVLESDKPISENFD